MEESFRSLADTPEGWVGDLHDYMLRRRQVQGTVPSSVGVTKNPEDRPASVEDILSQESAWDFLSQAKRGGSYLDPEGPSFSAYRDRRWEVISGELGTRPVSAVSADGRRRVGVGFDLDSPESEKIFTSVLGESSSTFRDVKEGKRGLGPDEAKRLFDFTSRPTEDIITTAAQEAGRTLTDRERISLVALESISPGSAASVLQGGNGDPLNEVHSIVDSALSAGESMASAGMATRLANLYYGMDDGLGIVPSNPADLLAERGDA